MWRVDLGLACVDNSQSPSLTVLVTLSTVLIFTDFSLKRDTRWNKSVQCEVFGVGNVRTLVE